MPGEKEVIDFINSLEKPEAPQHVRVMRRTYANQKPGTETYALFWKDPKFSDGSTAPYIALDIHYQTGQKNSGYFGGVWVKGIQNLSIKPENQKYKNLAFPIADYLAANGLSSPPAKPQELQDFDNTFYHVNEDLDAYQDISGHQRRR